MSGELEKRVKRTWREIFSRSVWYFLVINISFFPLGFALFGYDLFGVLCGFYMTTAQYKLYTAEDVWESVNYGEKSHPEHMLLWMWTCVMNVNSWLQLVAFYDMLFLCRQK